MGGSHAEASRLRRNKSDGGYPLRYHDTASGECPVKNVVKKCLNFSIRSSITPVTVTERRRRHKVWASGELFALSSFIVPGEARKQQILFENSEGATKSAGEVARNNSKQAGAEVAFPKVLLDTIASSTTRVCTVRLTRGTP